MWIVLRIVIWYFFEKFESKWKISEIKPPLITDYCLLCYSGINWFMGRFGRTTCTVHSISAQTSQEEIKCIKAKKIAKVLLSNIYILCLKLLLSSPLKSGLPLSSFIGPDQSSCKQIKEWITELRHYIT